MTTTEIAGTRNALTSMQRDILQDFKLSYRYAQGEPTSQKILFVTLAREYNPNMIGSLPQLNRRISQHLSGIKIPSQHQATVGLQGAVKIQEAALGEFKHQWGIFAKVIKRVSFGPELPGITALVAQINELATLHCETLQIRYLDRLLSKDWSYQDMGRQDRRGTSDPYESFFRTYVLDQQPTGSTRFDKIFQDLRVFFITIMTPPPTVKSEAVESVKRKLGALTNAWESRHPGKTFILPY